MPGIYSMMADVSALGIHRMEGDFGTIGRSTECFQVRREHETPHFLT
jgi:hypothetical protein